MSIIRDPDSLKGMGVTNAGYGKVDAFCSTRQLHANQAHKAAFTAVISVTPTGAGDCFFYLNNDDNNPIVVTGAKLRSASAEQVQIKLGDSGTVGGTHATLTPGSKYANSGVTFDHTCESGVDITGLSGGVVVDDIDCSTLMEKWIWRSGLVLPKNGMLSLYAVTGAVAIRATLSFYWWDVAHD